MRNFEATFGHVPGRLQRFALLSAGYGPLLEALYCSGKRQDLVLARVSALHVHGLESQHMKTTQSMVAGIAAREA